MKEAVSQPMPAAGFGGTGPSPAQGTPSLVEPQAVPGASESSKGTKDMTLPDLQLEGELT